MEKFLFYEVNAGIIFNGLIDRLKTCIFLSKDVVECSFLALLASTVGVLVSSPLGGRNGGGDHKSLREFSFFSVVCCSFDETV